MLFGETGKRIGGRSTGNRHDIGAIAQASKRIPKILGYALLGFVKHMLHHAWYSS